MDALIEDNIQFSNIENNVPVFTPSEEVQQVSVEEMGEKGASFINTFIFSFNT